MAIVTVMVHVEVDAPCDDRIRVAAGLSSRLHATLIGVTAWEPRPPLTYGGVVVDSKPTKGKLQEMSDRLAAVGEHFRMLVGEQQPTEWRAAIESPTEFLAVQARATDLVVIGRDRVAGDLHRSLDPGATILKAGRPVLVVPSGVDSLELRGAVIGWKDTREARRALLDSLPCFTKRHAWLLLKSLNQTLTTNPSCKSTMRPTISLAIELRSQRERRLMLPAQSPKN